MDIEGSLPARASRRALAAAALASLLNAPAGAGDELAEASTPGRLRMHGFADVVYAYNYNRPVDRANWFPGVGTAAKRHGEFSLNQAQVELTVDPAPVGFRLALGFGPSVEVVHAGEPAGAFVGAPVWRNVVFASASYKTQVGRGLLFEAGVFPCHVGFEGFNTKDNWNYTRSWLGELSPYYSAGISARYPLNDRWSAQVLLLNGWQLMADNNSAKTLGAQIGYTAGKASVSLNLHAGPELPEDDDDWRVLGDVVTTVKVTPTFSLGGSYDLAREGRPTGRATTWNGLGLYARLAPPGSKTSLAMRVERFDDGDGAISGSAQRLSEGTLTLEHRPAANLIVKLEGRYDHSLAGVVAAF